MRTVLMTGFEPFENDPLNPSWEAVRALDGQSVGGVVIAARQLPCVFGDAIDTLEAHMAELRPVLVIAVGLAGGRAEIAVERVGINIDDGRIPDNAGVQPIDEPIVDGGPAAYFATLPIKAIVRDLREAGVPAVVSQSAGTFLCNHVLYGLMHRIAEQAKTAAPGEPVARGGFMHIPNLPEQAARHPGQPSMSLETAIAGLRRAVATALETDVDVREQGGQLH